jgi:NAD(P)-dependent dehydrogenase (short-subunit alcohol dehydrogenase family)
MREGGGGSIINVSSIAGIKASPNVSGYCATKGGVRLFAKSIAMECAQADDGIRVNSVHPGIIDTPIWGKIPNGGGQLGHNTPMRAEELGRAGAPIGYAGKAQDIANGVLFLASDQSSYMTGAEIVIDGGITAGGVRRAPPNQ